MTAVFAQTFKSHIGLTDRLMNSYLLCDRSVVASVSALYEEVDVAKYNEEYDKFVICSKWANILALKPVKAKLISCKDASKILYAHHLTCQIARDNSSKDEVKECKNKIIKICNDYLKEKSK